MISWKVYPETSSLQQEEHVCVFLHGWLGSHRDWLSVVKEISSRITCVVVDLPGHGENPPLPPDSSWSFASLTQMLYQRLSGLPPFHLIGYSMGGRLALHYTLQHPNTVRTLTLESCQPGLADPKQREARAQLDQQRSEHIQTHGLEAFLQSWYNADLFRSLHQQTELLSSLYQRRTQNDANSVATLLKELSPGLQPSLWEKLNDLETPTLLLAGALDPKYSEIMSQMQQRIPNSQLAIVSDAGHNIHLESPSEWIAKTQLFLHQNEEIQTTSDT